jgi:hypothetical protein
MVSNINHNSFTEETTLSFTTDKTIMEYNVRECFSI